MSIGDSKPETVTAAVAMTVAMATESVPAVWMGDWMDG
jgi:hypothetical protein